MSDHPHTARHERTDAHIPTIVRFGIGLFVLIVVALIAMWGLFSYLAGGPVKLNDQARPVAARQPPPTGPILQVQPPDELRTMRERNAEILNTYGWQDRDMGVVRLPVERAMELLVEREGAR